MATYMQWLNGQVKRDDSVGWFSRYWRDLPDKPRLSSPDSIRKHLEQRELFASQEGLAAAYEATLSEYRQDHIQEAAAHAGMVLPGMTPVVAPAERSAPSSAYTGWPQQYLEAMNHKLDLICRALGIKGGLEPEQAVIIPAPPPPETWTPQQWEAMYATADHAAEPE